MATQTHPGALFHEFILRPRLFSHPYKSRNLSYRTQGMGMLHLLQKLKWLKAKENTRVLVHQLEGAEKQECSRVGGFKSQRRTGFT